MRARLPLVVVLVALLMSTVPVASAVGGRSGVVMAQQTEDQDTGGEGTGAEEDNGGPAAETGADEGQVEGGESEETGPPWTYQMARMSLALLILLGLAMAGLYWRLVLQRQRRGA